MRPVWTQILATELVVTGRLRRIPYVVSRTCGRPDHIIRHLHQLRHLVSRQDQRATAIRELSEHCAKQFGRRRADPRERLVGQKTARLPHERDRHFRAATFSPGIGSSLHVQQVADAKLFQRPPAIRPIATTPQRVEVLAQCQTGFEKTLLRKKEKAIGCEAVQPGPEIGVAGEVYGPMIGRDQAHADGG
jgi:hypothetical protein